MSIFAYGLHKHNCFYINTWTLFNSKLNCVFQMHHIYNLIVCRETATQSHQNDGLKGITEDPEDTVFHLVFITSIFLFLFCILLSGVFFHVHCQLSFIICIQIITVVRALSFLL